MTVKLLTDPHFRFLSLNEAAQARVSLHLSKYHIVGNLMPRLNCHSKRMAIIPSSLEKGPFITEHIRQQVRE